MRQRLVISLLAVVLAVAAIGQVQAADATDGPLQYKWLYLSNNFMNPRLVDDSIAVVKRAASAGYNGVFLTDCKFARWFENITVHRPTTTITSAGCGRPAATRT